MSEMVERVARAVFEAIPHQDARVKDKVRYFTWESYCEEAPTFAEQIRGQARAAIAAMREPTNTMVAAALDANLDIYWGYYADERPGGPDGPWRAMIDAALK